MHTRFTTLLVFVILLTIVTSWGVVLITGGSLLIVYALTILREAHKEEKPWVPKQRDRGSHTPTNPAP